MPLTRILDIESNLANILVKSWQGVYTSYMTRLLVALKAGNEDAARKIVSDFTLSSLTENSKALKSHTAMAFHFGTQQVSKAPTAKNDLEAEALVLFKAMVEKNVALQIKKTSLLVVRDFNKVRKAEEPSILHEFKSFATKVKTAAERNLRMATTLHTNRLASYGATAEMNVLGIKEYSINAQLDKKICPVCRVQHGRIFEVREARTLLQKVLKTKDPDKLKELQPWPDVKQAERISKMKASDLVDNGWHIPPFHGNPVSEDTEFLSGEGWKFVKDATVKDTAFSLNPITGLVEWVPVVKVIHAGDAPNGRMVHFKSQNADLLVTEHHDQIYLQYLNTGSQLAIKPAGELLPYSKITIPRGGKWDGVMSTMSLDMVKLLALWISDGSCAIKGDNSYYITLATRKYQKLAKELFEAVTGKSAHIRNAQVECYDTTLGKYLVEIVGRGAEIKQIPSEIMNATPEVISVFLNTYLIGDGSICNTSSQYGSSVNKIFYTINPVLAAQIGELIVKAGGVPSYSLQDNSDTRVLADGREITGKHLLHRIRWNISANATFGKHGKGTMGFVPYEGKTYCLTLERNHVFYARRNGKCIWTGNCRCLIIKIKDVPMMAMEALPSSIASGLNAKRYVPNPWDFVASGLNSSKEALEAYHEAIGISPMQLLAKMFGEPAGLMTRDFLEARGFKAILNEKELRFEVNNLMHGSENPVNFKGTIDFLSKTADLDVLTMLEGDATVAGAVFDSAVEGFKAAGLNAVAVNANVGKGSYAMSKYGFVPRDADEWAKLKKVWIAPKWKALRKTLPEKVAEVVDNIITSDDPQAIWDLADITFKTDKGALGEYLLKDSQWWAKLDLNDEHAMLRYEHYFKPDEPVKVW